MNVNTSANINKKKTRVKKACILAAGIGKRLAPLTDTRPKPLIPIAGKPLLQHTIEDLRDNDITEILLIVGYRKDQIIEYFGNGQEFGLSIQYKEQKEFLGTGHATQLAKDFAGSEPFMLIYGDLFMDKEIYSSVLESFSQDDYSGIIAAKKVIDPEKWGILQTDENQDLIKIIEKPEDDRFGTLANAGVYIFSSSIFEGIQNTEKSPRGEYELTDSIQYCIDHQNKIHITNISGYFWSDVGHPWQLLDATKHEIEKIPGDPVTKHTLPEANIINNGGIIEKFVTIHGPVVIGKGTILKSGTYIEGPVIIGENCQIGPNSYLRPYTSIGDNCKIGNGSEIKASIIMNHSAVPHLSYVGDSIIGEHVNLGCGSITANLRLDKKISIWLLKVKKLTHFDINSER